MIRPDETWHRLLSWTYGQAPSERLAAQILIYENYENIDPSHPLGGKDGAKDAVCNKENNNWLMAVYFPRNQKRFPEIKRKFKEDAEGVIKNSAHGLVFVTNQELTLNEREKLNSLVEFPVRIYHLERIAAILDSPSMKDVRERYLYINQNLTDAGSPDIHVSFHAVSGYELKIPSFLRKMAFINRFMPHNHGYGVVEVCVENKGTQKASNIKLKIFPYGFDSYASISDRENHITSRSWTSSMYLKFEFFDVNRGEILDEKAFFCVNYNDKDSMSEVSILKRVKTNTIKYELTCDDMPAKNGMAKIT